MKWTIKHWQYQNKKKTFSFHGFYFFSLSFLSSNEINSNKRELLLQFNSIVTTTMTHLRFYKNQLKKNQQKND